MPQQLPATTVILQRLTCSSFGVADKLKHIRSRRQDCSAGGSPGRQVSVGGGGGGGTTTAGWVPTEGAPAGAGGGGVRLQRRPGISGRRHRRTATPAAAAGNET